MSWRQKLEERRRHRQFLDELNAQRLEIERAIVFWILPLSILVGVLLGIWAMKF